MPQKECYRHVHFDSKGPEIIKVKLLQSSLFTIGLWKVSHYFCNLWLFRYVLRPGIHCKLRKAFKKKQIRNIFLWHILTFSRVKSKAEKVKWLHLDFYFYCAFKKFRLPWDRLCDTEENFWRGLLQPATLTRLNSKIEKPTSLKIFFLHPIISHDDRTIITKLFVQKSKVYLHYSTRVLIRKPN